MAGVCSCTCHDNMNKICSLSHEKRTKRNGELFQCHKDCVSFVKLFEWPPAATTFSFAGCHHRCRVVTRLHHRPSSIAGQKVRGYPACCVMPCLHVCVCQSSIDLGHPTCIPFFFSQRGNRGGETRQLTANTPTDIEPVKRRAATTTATRKALIAATSCNMN